MSNITYDNHPVKAAPAADDYIPIWDVSGNAAKKALRSALVGAVLTGGGSVATGGFTLTVPATGTAALLSADNAFSGANTFSASNTFTGRQVFDTGVGLQGTKSSVANNSATVLCDVIIGGASAMAASYVIGLAVTSGGASSAQTWVLTQGYNAATVTKLNEALFNHSSITLTASGDAGNRKVRLTITQVNGGSQACVVNIAVLPLMVASDPVITLTML